MSGEYSDEMDTDTKAALNGLAREVEPPPALEDRVVDALRRERLLSGGGSASWRRYLRPAVAVAAAAAIFLVGWLAGRSGPPAPGVGPSMPQFVLLLYNDPGIRELGPEEMARRVAEYSGWARSLHESGALVSAEKLDLDGRLVERSGGTLQVTQEVPTPPAGILTGFFLVRAPDYPAALRLAGESPHLRYGGRISIRRIDPT